MGTTKVLMLADNYSYTSHVSVYGKDKLSFSYCKNTDFSIDTVAVNASDLIDFDWLNAEIDQISDDWPLS